MLLEMGKSLVPLEPGQLYMLGKQINGEKKQTNNFIELEDEENVCPRHCIIETNHNEEAFVFDLFSLKGTVVNNKVLNSLEKRQLENGDILKVGNKEIKYICRGNEMSGDSSGFLEIQKNSSNIASSPETTQFQKHIDDHKFLVPARPSTSFSDRRSDSFTIPETQYCKSRNSVNDSNLSIAESIPDNIDKIFKFGDLDSFEDDDLCIPETQDIPAVEAIPCSQRPRLLSEIQNKVNQTSPFSEECLTLENRNAEVESMLRICTQDYNAGFGEEESSDGLQSQIMPIFKSTNTVLNKTIENSDKYPTNSDQVEKEVSFSNVDQETTDIRADCVTPDIFELEAITNKINENIDVQCANSLDEDEEDLLPTQCIPSVFKKVEKRKSLNELEEPCLDNEIEDVLVSSDKENRRPEILEPVADMPPTQLFEAADCHASITHSNSISSAMKSNPQDNKNSSQCLLNIEPDEEDDLLTQTFLQPKSLSVTSSSSFSKKYPNKSLSSILSDDKCTEKSPVTSFAEINKTPFKQMPISSVNIFKKPDNDIGNVKKTSSSSSTTSDNYIDLLMCTPQVIKDNWSLENTEDLKKHILAVKNRNLFGDETEDEEDDDQSNLVKLINVPKSSLDFDQLLPHLNKTPESSPKKHDEQNEAQKKYKFSISFGKEQDEKQSKSTTSKTLSRDERHAARDKEREISERKPRYKSLTRAQEKKLVRKEKEIERKERDKQREDKEQKRLEKKKENKKKESEPKLREKEMKSNESSDSKRVKESKNNLQDQSSNDKKADINQESSTRLRKRKVSEKNETEISKADNNPTPAKRLTRAKSRLEDTSSQNTNSKEGEIDIDSIVTEPVAKVTRSRSKTKQTDSTDSTTSNASTKTTKSDKNKIKTEDKKYENVEKVAKKTQGKRSGEAPAEVMPAKIERKRLRSVHSQESLASSLPSVAVSTTNVDPVLINNLFKNSKGLWNIAKNPADSDILVMDKPLRTFKFLLAVAKGTPVVTTEYLKKLNESKSHNEVRYIDYHFLNSDFEKKYKFSLLKSLQEAKKQKIFKDYEFLLTASILPMPQEIKAIIEVAGGKVHNKSPPQPKENQKLYLVTVEDDKKDWHKYRRLNKNIIFVSTEAIMSAIMCQSTQRMKLFTLT